MKTMFIVKGLNITRRYFITNNNPAKFFQVWIKENRII